MKFLLISLITLILFTACSNKNQTQTDWKKDRKILHYVCKNKDGNYRGLTVPNIGNVEEKLKKFTQKNNFDYKSCYTSKYFEKWYINLSYHYHFSPNSPQRTPQFYYSTFESLK